MMKVLEKDNKKTVFKGEVIPGRQIGRTIGFPTANLRVNSEEEPYLPKGVYGVQVYYKGVSYRGVMNIGIRPTFKGEKPTVSFEVYILDFNQDIYGEQLTIDILFFIRNEQAFDSIEQLVQQLKNDIEKANEQFLLVNC
ncbi:riboflavin kinase [Peribacillus asahii]|uniref:riboflavin kinase n=1 Tax=Peribacillus asahii TaxID=228899 RepID=UPI0020799FE4|nr:riboflavin kinase [Peribacillus asahii]USK70900.1 riboflavin kinase [Peribacillus asahii]